MKPKFIKPKGSLMAALDIGSSKVACFIGRVNDESGGFEILGVGHHASAGIQGGAISDSTAAEKIVRQTVHAAEHMAADSMRGYPLQDIVVNLPDAHSTSRRSRVQVEISGHEVTKNDVERALSNTQHEVLSSDYELVHTIPAHYKLDGAKDIRDPVGMHGQTLEMDIHLVTGEIGVLQNVASVVGRSHLEVDAFCVASYAAGLSSLVDDEMDLGCTVIDMGGGVTSFSVFHEGALLYSDAVPLGGRHVTNDLAKGLTTSLSNAERIKALYGSAMASSNDDQELIDVPPLGEEEHAEPNHVQRSMLVGIIQPRIEEIFELIRANLNDSGLGHALGRRVVLTGGASQLAGLKDFVQYVMDKQVRLGKPIRLGGLPDAVSGPAFSTVSGLLSYAAYHSDEMPATIMQQAETGDFLKRAGAWLKENW